MLVINNNNLGEVLENNYDMLGQDLTQAKSVRFRLRENKVEVFESYSI
jgi:hypothetical protein